MAQFNRKLPSEHEAERGARERAENRQEEAQMRAAARLRQSVDAALKSEWGQVLWVHLFHLCGYNKSSLSRLSTNDIAVLTTECKEAQRLVYIELRKLASPDVLAKIEQLAEFGAPTTAAETEKKGGK